LYCVLIDGLMAIAPAPMPLDALPELLRVIAWLMEKGPKDTLLSCFRALEHIVLTNTPVPTESVQTLASMAAAMVRRLRDLTGQKSPGYSPPDHDDDDDDDDAKSDQGAELELRAKMLATIWDMGNRWPVFLDAVCQSAYILDVIGHLCDLLKSRETFNSHAVSLFMDMCFLMIPVVSYALERHPLPHATDIILQQLVLLAKQHAHYVGVARAFLSMLLSVPAACV